MQKAEEAEKQKAEKAKDVKSTVQECIRAGLDFSKTKKELKSRGINYPNLSKTFYQWREEIQPEGLRSEALSTLKEKREAKRAHKPLLPTPKAWNKGRQKEADECVFADAINEGVFYFIPCPKQGLTIEQVKEINLGGAIVGVVTFYTNVNLNHPVIVLVTRAILLVLKVRQMCYILEQKYSELKVKARGAVPGQGGVHST